MPLGHITQTRSGMELFEPIYSQLYEVKVEFPEAVRQLYPTANDYESGDGRLILETAKSLSFKDIYKKINTDKQKFKYSTREYVGLVDGTTVSGSLEFEMYHNEEGSMLINDLWRAWYDLAWNSQNGFHHAKRNMVGKIIVNFHEKEGRILRRLVFNHVQVVNYDDSMTGPSFKGGTHEEKGKVEWISDYWIDANLDHRIQIQGGN